MPQPTAALALPKAVLRIPAAAERSPAPACDQSTCSLPPSVAADSHSVRGPMRPRPSIRPHRGTDHLRLELSTVVSATPACSQSLLSVHVSTYSVWWTPSLAFPQGGSRCLR